MKNTLFCTLLILILSKFQAYTQSIILQGEVRDFNSKIAIPYANISIENGNIGTPTNLDGKFILKIPADLQNSTLLFSFIGYESYRLKINTIQNPNAIIIYLKESENLLKQIMVSAESPAQIVAHAYQNIPLNYPLSNTLYTGFYRESNLHHLKDSAEKYFYVIEAITKINKPSYQKRQPEGEIKLLQVRKNQFVPTEQKFGKWIAGAFTPMRFDVVKKRFDFIDPDYQDRYTYSLEDFTTYYDKEVYQIRFVPAKNSANYEGVLYIDVQSYAIVKVDYQFSKKGLQRENIGRAEHSLLENRQFKINYQPLGDKWYIQSVWQQAIGEDVQAKDFFRYLTEYATTRIDTNTYENFEYGDKIQWGDVFLTKNDTYNENFWKDYNIVAETQTLKNILIDTTYQLSIRKENILDTITPSPKDTKPKNQTRFRPYSAFLNPYLIHSSARQIALQYTNESGSFSIDETLHLKNTQLAWSSGFGAEYDVYKNLYFTAQVYFGFTKLKYNTFDIGLGYRFLLSKEKKRPLHLSIEFNYTFANLIRKVADYTNPDDQKIEVEGTIFDTPKVRLELFNQQTALKPKLGLQMEINRSFSIFSEIGYLIQLTKDESLLFSNENKNGALGQINLKKQSIDFSNARLDFRLDGLKATKLLFTTSLFLNVGIKGFLRLK